MPEYIRTTSTIALFADGSKLYKTFTIQHPTGSDCIQSDLSNLSLWCNDWNISTLLNVKFSDPSYTISDSHRGDMRLGAYSLVCFYNLLYLRFLSIL